MFIRRIEMTSAGVARRDERLNAKRVFDIACALLLLVPLLPLVAAVCLAIRMEGPGPLLFSQPRLGRGGRPFRLYKFRKFHARIDRQGPSVTLAEDARMTRVGRFLQRTKLDELPQLWNVLRGEMSMVGPRPEAMTFADCFASEFAGVLRYTPGLFGPTQVFFRNESVLFPETGDVERFYRDVLFGRKAQVDLAYYPQATVLRDLLWMIRGFLVVVVPAFSRSSRGDVLQQVDAWLRTERRRTARSPAPAIAGTGSTLAE